MKSNPIVRCCSVMLIGIGLLTAYWCGSHVPGIQHRTDVTNALLIADDELCNLLLNAETGQRGFVITGSESYLDPYHYARSGLPKALTALDNLDLDAQQNAFRDAVKPAIAAKMAELAYTITLRRDSGLGSAMDAVQTNDGRILMDHIRSLFRQQREATIAVLADLRRSSAKMIRGIISGLALAILGSLAFVFPVKPKARPVVPLPDAVF